MHLHHFIHIYVIWHKTLANSRCVLYFLCFQTADMGFFSLSNETESTLRFTNTVPCPPRQFGYPSVNLEWASVLE